MLRTPGSARSSRAGCRLSSEGVTLECSPPRQPAAIGCHLLSCALVPARGSPQSGPVTSTLDPVHDLAAQAALIGGPDDVLAEDDVSAFVADQLAGADLDGRSVCVIVPDATRSCPLPLLLEAVHGALAGGVPRRPALIALGPPAPMPEAQLPRHLGFPAGDVAGRYPGLEVRNHDWADPDTFVFLGTIPGSRV